MAADSVSFTESKMPNGQGIIDPLSLNLYTYCYGNPVRYTDPSGNIPVETVLDVASLGWSINNFISDPSLENFGYAAWDVAATAIPYAPGSYAAKGIKVLSRLDNYTHGAKSVWAMKWSDRGYAVEKMLGGMCNNFPTIDKYKIAKYTNSKTAMLSSITSIKSMDVTAKTYQNGSKFKSMLKGYVDSLANFKATSYQGILYVPGSSTTRILELAVPPVEMTASQARAYQEVLKYAKNQGVKIVLKIVN